MPLGVSQRPLTLILLQKYRDTNGSRIVIQIGRCVYTILCGAEDILLQKYRDTNGRCIVILFKSIRVRSRLDSPDANYSEKRPCPAILGAAVASGCHRLLSADFLQNSSTILSSRHPPIKQCDGKYSKTNINMATKPITSFDGPLLGFKKSRSRGKDEKLRQEKAKMRKKANIET